MAVEFNATFRESNQFGATFTLMLIDSEGRVYENKHLTTAYVAPTEGE